MPVYVRLSGVWIGLMHPIMQPATPPLHSPTLQPNSVPSHPTSGLPLELGTQQVLEVLLQEACVSRGLAYPRIG